MEGGPRAEWTLAVGDEVRGGGGGPRTWSRGGVSSPLGPKVLWVRWSCWRPLIGAHSLHLHWGQGRVRSVSWSSKFSALTDKSSRTPFFLAHKQGGLAKSTHFTSLVWFLGYVSTSGSQNRGQLVFVNIKEGIFPHTIRSLRHWLSVQTLVMCATDLGNWGTAWKVFKDTLNLPNTSEGRIQTVLFVNKSGSRHTEQLDLSQCEGKPFVYSWVQKPVSHWLHLVLWHIFVQISLTDAPSLMRAIIILGAFDLGVFRFTRLAGQYEAGHKSLSPLSNIVLWLCKILSVPQSPDTKADQMHCREVRPMAKQWTCARIEW